MVKFTINFLTATLFILSCSPNLKNREDQRGNEEDNKSMMISSQINKKDPYLEESIKSEFKVKANVDSSVINKYCWCSNYDFKNNVINRISVPDGFKRSEYPKGSFPDWLRHLPLKEAGANVKLYNGSLKGRQDVHFAVIDIDPGNKDLQQCADACIRLKAEYHYSKGEYSKIHFKFTSGDNAEWIKWKNGYRLIVKGNKISWIKSARQDSSYNNFRNYLNIVFNYAGSQSLSQEMSSKKIENINPGDIFIKGGFPGHAVIVIDVAENTRTKENIFLLAQSYMPAQEIHILKNFNDSSLNPWYNAKFIDLETPEWTFMGSCLKQFK